MKEEWKTIEGYENYEISSFGNCRKKGSEQNLKPQLNSAGYVRYELRKNGKTKMFFAHRLGAKAFLKNPENKPQVNHKDNNKLNNHISNLEYCTQSENVQQQYKDGRISRKINGKIFCVEENRIFNTVEETANAYNVHRRSVYNVLNGPVEKLCKKYTLVYKKD